MLCSILYFDGAYHACIGSTVVASSTTERGARRKASALGFEPRL